MSKSYEEQNVKLKKNPGTLKVAFADAKVQQQQLGLNRLNRIPPWDQPAFPQ